MHTGRAHSCIALTPSRTQVIVVFANGPGIGRAAADTYAASQDRLVSPHSQPKKQVGRTARFIRMLHSLSLPPCLAASFGERVHLEGEHPLPPTKFLQEPERSQEQHPIPGQFPWRQVWQHTMRAGEREGGSEGKVRWAREKGWWRG